MERGRGGLTTKIHALTDGRSLPLDLVLTPGPAADCPAAAQQVGRLREGTILCADKAYRADWALWGPGVVGYRMTRLAQT